MHVLITGGAGFIGSHLAEALVAKGCDVTILDCLVPQVHGGRRPTYLPRKARFIRASVCNAAAVRRAARNAHAIVHLAAEVGVGQSQYEIRRYVDANVGGTGVLLDSLVDRRLRRRLRVLVVAGSMSAYGEGAYECSPCGRVRPPIRSPATAGTNGWDPPCPRCGGRRMRPVATRESDGFACTSVYAVTKAAQEDLVLTFGAAYGVRAVALRFFNVYGPRQALSNSYTGVAAIFISRLKNRKPPVIYEDGGQMRDFVHVRDVVQACVRAIETETAHGPYNIGTGRPTSVRSLADHLRVLMDVEVEPKVSGLFRAGDVRHCWADISKAADELGYRPQVDLRDGLRELIEWAAEQPAMDRFEKAHRELAARGLVAR